MLINKSFQLNRLYPNFLLVIVTIFAVSCSDKSNVPKISDAKSSYSLPLSKEGSLIKSTVNPYLWRAAILKMDFVPLKTLDPISGLIISDWYLSEDSTNERIKITVYILDSQLRPDALKVVITRQRYDGRSWIGRNVNPYTVRALEDAILEEARSIYLAG